MYVKLNILFFLITAFTFSKVKGQELLYTLNLDTNTFFLEQIQQVRLPEWKTWENIFPPLKTAGKGLLKNMQPGLSLLWDGYYFSGDTAYIQDEGFYNSLLVDGSLTVAGVPLNCKINSVFLNKEYRPSLSSFSFSFDSQRLKDNIKEQWIKAKVSQFNMTMPDPDLAALKNRFDYERMELLFTNSKFIQDKLMIITDIKNCMIDPVLNKADSLYIDGLQKKSAAFQQVDSLRGVVIDYQSNISQRSVFLKDSLFGKVRSLESEWNNAQPGSLYQKIKGIIKVPDFHRFLMVVNRFEIGQFSLEGSPFTVNGYPYNGISANVQPGKYDMSVSYGKQLQQAEFITPFSINDYSNGNRMLTAQVKKNDIEGNQYSISGYRFLSAPPDTLPGFEKQNMVFSLKANQQMIKGSELESELAYARLALTQVSFSEGSDSGNGILPYMAFRSTIKYKFEDQPVNIGLGYSYIGSRYITLGNPFLINNRQALNAEINAGFFKKRVTVKGTLSKTINTTDSVNSIPLKLMLWSAEARYQSKKGIFVSFRYAPFSILQGYEGDQQLSNSTNIYLFQVVYPHRIGKEKNAMLLFTASNFNSALTFADTVRVSNATYYFLSELIPLNSTLQLSASLNLGFNYDTRVWDQNYMISGMKRLSAISASLGFQASRRTDGIWMGGIQMSLSRPMNQKWELGFSGIYRKAIQNGFDKIERYCNIFMRYILF